MNKKAITEMMLVTIVATIIGAVVFLTVLWPAFSGTLKGAQSRGECNWNLMLAAGFKAGTFGFGEIEPGCKAQYTTVDATELLKYHTLAKQRIKKYCTSQGYVGAAASTGQQYTTATAQLCTQGATYNDLNEWALNNIMAKKMVSCWDKVWHGKLDFFRQELGNRSVCVVCDVTTFSEDFPAVLKTKDITTLYDWLNTEPYYQTTYYDYLVEGQTFKPAKENMVYNMQKPLAVIYIQTKDGYWNGLVIGAAAGYAAGSTVSGLTGGIFNPFTLPAPIIGTFIGAVSGYFADTPDNTRQIFVMPYDGLRYICTDIIA